MAHRPPKIIMLNNAKLKETLFQKVTATTADPVQNRNTGVAERTAEEMILPSLTVVLTFSLPLDEAQFQMKRIQELVRSLGLQPTVQPQPGPAMAGVPQSAPQSVPKPDPVPTTAAARIQTQVKHTASPALMTDKQKKMIFALIARKKLSPESVSDILERDFGHQDGARLTKTEASKLIDRLMAM